MLPLNVVKFVLPLPREVTAQKLHSSVVVLTAPTSKANALLPLPSEANAHKPLRSVAMPPRLLLSEVIAVAPLRLLACVPPPAPPQGVMLPQPLPDVTFLIAPIDLAVHRHPEDVMPLAVAVPPMPPGLSRDVELPPVLTAALPHRGLQEVLFNLKDLHATSTIIEPLWQMNDETNLL